MSTGYKAFNVDLGNYFQPFFSGSETQELSGYKINGVQAFARRDNDPNNAPTAFNTGYKYNGVDISSYTNKINASLTVQLSRGSKTYNGQPQQATVALISPTNSWITVQTSTVINAGIYSVSDFTFYPPNGYTNFTVLQSSFQIVPSTISISANGPTSFTWTGSQIDVSYTVTGVYPQDTNWFVTGTSESGAGNYTATLITTSGNYEYGQNTLSWTINAVAPSAPTIGTTTSGDKLVTANWTASSSTGGDTVTYYVSYSTNGGTTWSSESTTTSTSYDFSGNGVIYNGNTYIVRVRATNSSGIFSDYSANLNGVVPTFAAPTVQSINFASPSTSNPNVRPFTITFTPTSCVNYSITRIYVQNTTLESGFINGYYDSVNGGFNNFFTQSTGQQTTGTVSNVYAQTFASGSGFFTNGVSTVFSVKVITYNNDGYGVESSSISNTSPATQFYYVFNPASLTFSNGIQLYQTGQFTVGTNTFSQISNTFISSNDWYVNRLNVSARTATLSSTITLSTSSRIFFVDYSFSTPSSFTQILNGSTTSPFNQNASTTRNLNIDIADVNYDNNGDGRIRVRGGGTIGTWSAGQNILVTVTAFGQTRTLTPY
jgi:hypothetical protein